MSGPVNSFKSRSSVVMLLSEPRMGRPVRLLLLKLMVDTRPEGEHDTPNRVQTESEEESQLEWLGQCWPRVELKSSASASCSVGTNKEEEEAALSSAARVCAGCWEAAVAPADPACGCADCWRPAVASVMSICRNDCRAPDDDDDDGEVAVAAAEVDVDVEVEVMMLMMI